MLHGQRYVIFSDLHKGRRTPADEFRFCEATYLAALDHYYKNGYTLVILGDAEELWEEPDIGAVMQANANVLESERRFHPERYVRVNGNHDNAWRIEQLVKEYLDPIFPGIQVRREFCCRSRLSRAVRPARSCWCMGTRARWMRTSLISYHRSCCPSIEISRI